MLSSREVGSVPARRRVMFERTRLLAASASVVTVMGPPPSHAQAPTGGAPPPPTTDPAKEPNPSLKDHPDAAYPPDALRDRLEGSVGLELTVDANGAVVDARVTQPAGHGFDEAALAAVKQWTFEPAKNNGHPMRATVQLALPFQLPSPTAPPPAPTLPSATPSAPALFATAPVISQAGESTVVLGRKPISAASSFAVRDRDFSLRPVDSVQDILRVTPGLVMVQHSGGGKANQYFLRGFDADHGTDVALSIDGIPINMVSHAHGQGFSDTNFIIPETVERIEITKGTYFANQGDFATAGATPNPRPMVVKTVLTRPRSGPVRTEPQTVPNRTSGRSGHKLCNSARGYAERRADRRVIPESRTKERAFRSIASKGEPNFTQQPMSQTTQ